MRVGIFVSSVGGIGGTIRVAVSMANRLCSDVSVTLFELTDHQETPYPIDSRVSIVSLGVDDGRIRQKVRSSYRALKKALSTHPVDLMLGIGLDETVEAISPCLLRRVPLVCCDHGALINQLDDRSTTFLRRVCVTLCPKTVTLTRQTLEDYQRIMHVPARKLVCIPNWIPDYLFANAQHYNPSLKRILWAGRLDAEKGVDHLVAIAAQVLPSRPDWIWDVYGASVLENTSFNIVDEIEQAGISKQLRLCGTVDDMPDRYPHYSIGTLTSYREGLPLFLLEGKASGLPLISFDVDTGPRDIIKDGQDGFLIKPYDCTSYAQHLAQLMDSEQLRAQFSAASQYGAEVFSESRVSYLWLDLFDEMTGNKIKEAAKRTAGNEVKQPAEK